MTVPFGSEDEELLPHIRAGDERAAAERRFGPSGSQSKLSRGPNLPPDARDAGLVSA
jgi:hypothetical protein